MQYNVTCVIPRFACYMFLHFSLWIFIITMLTRAFIAYKYANGTGLTENVVQSIGDGSVMDSWTSRPRDMATDLATKIYMKYRAFRQQHMKSYN